jgi:hypothetical protein
LMFFKIFNIKTFQMSGEKRKYFIIDSDRMKNCLKKIHFLSDIK